MTASMISMKITYDFPTGVTSVADPHRKNADADPGKNLNADADPMRIHALTEL
jgi:hypothetical protein